jgi:hypothetical protein
MAKEAEKLQVNPLRPSEFGLITHTVRQFNASVPGNLTIQELEDPALWVNVANKLEMTAEVRILADDMSFIAYGICTYAQGTTAKIKIISRHKLDEVDTDEVIDEADDYITKLRGPKKWCIVKKSLPVNW